MSAEVEDFIKVLDEESESLEDELDVDESDEGDGAMNPSDEEVMNEAVKDLRERMKAEKEAGRANLRGGGKDKPEEGGSDEDY